MNGKYHKLLGFPQVEIPSGTRILEYTAHALRAANDRYGQIPKLNRITFTPDDVFEIVVVDGKVEKFAVRFPYSGGLDLTLVISYNRVVTQWLNRNDDEHSTLDVGAYSLP
jgi:hypothetical protein